MLIGTIKYFQQTHINSFLYLCNLIPGDISSKTTLGPFLTLSVRNGLNLQSFIFQGYISLNPCQQNYTVHI